MSPTNTFTECCSSLAAGTTEPHVTTLKDSLRRLMMQSDSLRKAMGANSDAIHSKKQVELCSPDCKSVESDDNYYEYDRTTTDEDESQQGQPLRPSKRQRYERRNSKTPAMFQAESNINTASILYHLDCIQDIKECIEYKNKTNSQRNANSSTSVLLTPAIIPPQKQHPPLMSQIQLPTFDQWNVQSFNDCLDDLETQILQKSNGNSCCCSSNKHKKRSLE